jgi:hypothetical protein
LWGKLGKGGRDGVEGENPTEGILPYSKIQRLKCGKFTEMMTDNK